MSRPLFLGHRGTRIYAPENTFAAFDAAIEHARDTDEFIDEINPPLPPNKQR